MPRPATGQVVEKHAERGTVYALRFRAYGQRRYLTLGSDADGWTRSKAEAELTLTLAQVERGKWTPPVAPPVEAPAAEQTFHEFASEWYAQNERGWELHTAKTYRSLLSNHLLPFFSQHTPRQITVAEVDRYREDRLADGARRLLARERVLAYNLDHPKHPKPLTRKLGTTTINKTLVLLGSILAVAEERGLVDRNPLTVNPQRRKAKRERRRPVYLDSAEHIAVLLEAADDLDAAPDALTGGRRAMIATLALAGLQSGGGVRARLARREPRDRLAVRRLKNRSRDARREDAARVARRAGRAQDLGPRNRPWTTRVFVDRDGSAPSRRQHPPAGDGAGRHAEPTCCSPSAAGSRCPRA